jgi:tetratricopeptide (TPR) repeat protein
MTSEAGEAGRHARWLRRRFIVTILVLLVVLTGAMAVIWQRRATDQILREGEELLAAHEYIKARERLTQYLAVRPNDARALLIAARSARGQREYYEATELLNRCRASNGSLEAIGVEFELIDLQRGKQTPSPSLRDRAHQGDELALAILEVLIQYDLDTYRLGQALDELNTYLASKPNDLQALLTRGYIWERLLYFADAVTDYRQAVANHPENEIARLRLADTLLIVGTPAEALDQYQQLARTAPDRAEVKLGQAKCLRRLARTDEAIPLLDELLTKAPAHGQALAERGEIDLENGRTAEAEKLLRRSLTMLPHDRRVNYSLSQCLKTLGSKEAADFDERVKQIDADLRSLDRIRAEVMKKPDDAALRCEGGILFLRNGERTEGIRWLRMALALDPSCQTAKAELQKADTATNP